ncbi:MAG TPA: hypothetical protein VMU04_22485 [Candidatus Acidoferrum sp.]|nr:hypothetical protein [Candidatus Acidoferrum sp.]
MRPFNSIPSATSPNYVIPSAGTGDVGNYYVIATNPLGTNAQSLTASLALLPPPKFTAETYAGPGFGIQLYFTGPMGSNYSLWSSANVALTPVTNKWMKLTSGSFSGSTDSYTDSSAATNPESFYILTLP